MTGKSTQRISKVTLIGSVTLLAIGILGLVGRLFAAHDEGGSWVNILSVFALIIVGTLLFILLLAGLFDWRNARRTRVLMAGNPTAFFAQLVSDPVLMGQVDSFAVQLTGRKSKVRLDSYLTLVADRSSIRIFGGSAKPREAVSFPTSTLVGATIGASQSGIRIVPCLELSLDNGDGSTTIDVHLFQRSLGIPRFVRGDRLDAALREFRSATGLQG